MESQEGNVHPEAGGVSEAGPHLTDLVADVVEQRAERRPAGGIDWPSRAFVGAVEGTRGRDRAAERPRAGAFLVAILLCLVVVSSIAAWPALVNGLRHAGSRPQQARITTPAGRPGAPLAQVPGASPQVGTAPANPAAGLPIVGGGLAPAPAGPQAAAPQQPSQPQPSQASQPLPSQPQTSTQQTSTQQAAQQTPAGSQVVNPSLQGQWNSLGKGGFPNFTGPIWWTTSNLSATWTLSNVTNSHVKVEVWIPNTMAGALVNYTVDGAEAKAITQEWHNNWQDLGNGNTFPANGTMTVRMTYTAAAQVQSTPDPACINGKTCTAMAAAQVRFTWQ